MERYIKIYSYSQSPRDLQIICDVGGDENWVIVVPKAFEDIPPDFSSAINDSDDIVYSPTFGWLHCVDSDNENWYIVATHS